MEFVNFMVDKTAITIIMPISPPRHAHPRSASNPPTWLWRCCTIVRQVQYIRASCICAPALYARSAMRKSIAISKQQRLSSTLDQTITKWSSQLAISSISSVSFDQMFIGTEVHVCSQREGEEHDADESVPLDRSYTSTP